MKCKNCDNDAVGRSKYCGDSCKVLYNRKQKSVNSGSNDQTVNKTVTKLRVPPMVAVVGDFEASVTVSRTATYEDYLANPDDYAKRNHADWLNWGEWLSADALAKASMVVGHTVNNRVTLPGDWDYQEVT